MGMGWKFMTDCVEFQNQLGLSGGIDCIWNSFQINGRRDDYTWSDAYLNNKQVFVVEDSGIETK